MTPLKLFLTRIKRYDSSSQGNGMAQIELFCGDLTITPLSLICYYFYSRYCFKLYLIIHIIICKKIIVNNLIDLLENDINLY